MCCSRRHCIYWVWCEYKQGSADVCMKGGLDLPQPGRVTPILRGRGEGEGVGGRVEGRGWCSAPLNTAPDHKYHMLERGASPSTLPAILTRFRKIKSSKLFPEGAGTTSAG
ncbi:hypothetical protein E2C01_080777 [Portunus trituberculatus]|uniref:Uncharacterized protein n=1 Tax=Portunus trituberculatus TaxID=210409 RepID=A0A5B7IUX1_PORTR|nr:hypothetical protein [Portunus trituberculatus]